MISKRLLFILCFFCCRLSFGYIIEVRYNYGAVGNHTEQVGRAVLLASLASNNVEVVKTVTDREFIDSGYSGALGFISPASTQENQISFGARQTVNDSFNWYLCLWPISQNGQVYTCAYSILLLGEDGVPLPGDIVGSPEELYYYADSGVVDITNMVSGVVSAELPSGPKTHYFPYSLEYGSFSYMNPSQTGFSVSWSENRSYISGRVQPGSLYEFITLVQQVNNNQIFWRYGGNGSNNGHIARDIVTNNWVLPSDLPGPIGAAVGSYSYNSSSFRTYIQNFDTDAGSEPDLHEFFTLHNYTNPQDDWVYSGDSDYPVNQFSVESFGPEAMDQLEDLFGDGGGVGDNVVVSGFSQNALSQLIGGNNINNAELPEGDELDGDYGSDDEIADIEGNESFIDDAEDAADDVIPDAVGDIKEMARRLSTPSQTGPAPITLNLEADLTNTAIGSKIFEGCRVTLDFDDMYENEDIGDMLRLLRTIVVFALWVSIVIYILRDNLLLGKS